MRHLIVAGVLGLSAPLAAQTTIDRVLVRVHGEIITQSDVRQARLLKLFGPRPDADTTDAALQRELENRRLLLAEVARLPLAEPPAEARAARRQALVAALGPGADLPQLLERAGMTDSGLDEWCRNDLRIEALLDDRFKNIPPASRPAAVAAWVDELRRRAGLR